MTLKTIPILMIGIMLLHSPATEAWNKPSPPKTQSKYGGTLVWGTTNAPTIISPTLTSHSVSMDLLDIIFNRLVRVNSKGKIEPDLAQQWDISDDKLVYTFHLREGVKFHDDIECTAEDVVFTYRQLINPENHSPFSSHFDLVDKFEAIDKYTFKITLKQPFPPLLFKLVREIIPKHILVNEDLKNTPFNYSPVGTGPFKFKSWNRKTDQIELQANRNYFEGRPYLDTILIKVYPDNTSLWAAFMGGEVDFVKFINYEDYLILEKDPAFRVYKIPLDMYYALVYNPQDSVLFDSEIRKAIAHGINVEKLTIVISGEGIKSTGPFHPKSEGFNLDVRPLEYNPVKARMMLMHRGWRDKDNDGIFEKGGRELELRILINSRSGYYKKMAAMIRQQLSEIGIKVKLLLYEEEDNLTKEYLEKHKPQAWLRFYQGLGNDADEAIGSWYSNSSQFGKLWSYKNENVDRLFELGRITKNKKERAKTYQKAHKIIYKDQPACFLYFPMSFHSVSAKFKNTDDFFCLNMPVYSIKDWHIIN